MILEQDKETIAAVSTAPGAGGIAVVRISGPRALEVVKKVAPFLPDGIESHRVYYGTVKEPLSRQPVDEVLISYFAKGKSFTGEEVLEISCHGGDWLAHQILNLLLNSGARLANRGEFTYRAFMNGRLDLVQAEAVLSLIESTNKASARAALRQLKGASSKRLEEILDSITWVAAHLEANIDYAQEDIEVKSHASLSERLGQVQSAISEILASENQARLWNEGFHVALMGVPNVGKSSLFNSLLNEDRAIVTDIPGTTRDLVEGQLQFHGVRVLLTDTAGLREAQDQVEKLGVEKTRATGLNADLILFLYDGRDQALVLDELARFSHEQLARVRIVRNKGDLLNNPFALEIEDLAALARERGQNELCKWLLDEGMKHSSVVSAKTHEGLEILRESFEKSVQSQLVDDAPMSLRTRHVEILRKAKKAVEKAQDLLNEDSSPEFTAFELKDAVLSMHEILGRRFDDQVMDRVFKEFCLGK